MDGVEDGAQGFLAFLYCSIPSNPFWFLSQIHELVPSTGYHH
jgi:hypothetical protein